MMPKPNFKCVDLFDFRVAGIPCQIAVTRIEPGTPAFLNGPPDRCYPAEGGEVDYVVLDRRGYVAEWLQRKITQQDDDDIYEKAMMRLADG